MTNKVFLASKSPRRYELLSMLGYENKVIVSDIDESAINDTDPASLVMKLASLKGNAVKNLATDQNTPIISADTIVVANGEVLGKPKGREDAKRMLKMISGRKHSVYTGYSVIAGGREYSGFEKTDVFVREISDSELNEYLDTSEPYDKAGAYGIQGKAGAFISGINGDYYSVVGLPICKISSILNSIKRKA